MNIYVNLFIHQQSLVEMTDNLVSTKSKSPKVPRLHGSPGSQRTHNLDRCAIFTRLDYQELAKSILAIEQRIVTKVEIERTIKSVTNCGTIVTDIPIDITALNAAILVEYNSGKYNHITDRLQISPFGNTGLARIICTEKKQLTPIRVLKYRDFTEIAGANGLTVSYTYVPFNWLIVTGNTLYTCLLNTRVSLQPDIFINNGTFQDNNLCISAVSTYTDIILPGRTFIYDPILGFEREIYNIRTLHARSIGHLLWIDHVRINRADFQDTEVYLCNSCNTELYNKYYFNLGMRHCKICAHRAGLATSERNPAMVRKAKLTYSDIVVKLGLEPELQEAFLETNYEQQDRRCYINDNYILFAGTISAYLMCADEINKPLSNGRRKKVIMVDVVDLKYYDTVWM